MTPEEHYAEAQELLKVLSSGDEIDPEDYAATSKVAELHLRAAEIGLQMAALNHKKTANPVGYRSGV